jgi:phospholipase/carboxylesterase
MPLLNDLPLSYRVEIPSGRDPGEPMPLVLSLHGRGSDANDLAELAPMLDSPPGYRFIFPQAPRPFTPSPGMTFGYSWFDGWPAEKRSIHESRRLLLEFLDAVLERYPAPDGRIVLSGFSQGALMSLDAGFRTGQTLAGIVVMSGAVYEVELPDFRARAGMPVLIVHGTDDDTIPVLAARRARAVLEEHGLSPEYEEFAMGHYVIPESIARVRGFIRKCMGR